mgnify:CR=1 FL=1
MDIVREIRITLRGFGKHPLNDRYVLLKMINMNTTIAEMKTLITEKVETTEESKGNVINESCQLVFKQEVLWDDYQLLHYNFRNVLGANYAELELYYKEEMAEQAVEDVSKRAKNRWSLAGAKVRKKVHAAFVPDPETASAWEIKSGHPYESASTRHAKYRGGTHGIIELLSSYPKHCTSIEECCWCLLTMSSESEEAIEFRQRLIEREGVTPLVLKGLHRGLKKKHFGAIKQTIGLLWYLAKDQKKEYVQELIDAKLMILCTEAIKLSSFGLSGIKLEDKPAALASVFSDILELSGNLIFEMIQSNKEGKGQYKKLKLKELLNDTVQYLDGLIYPRYVTDSFDQCTRMKKKKNK